MRQCETSAAEVAVARNPDDPERELDLILSLRAALEKLSGYDLLLVHLAFECHLTLQQIAERVGVTPQRIHAQLKALTEGLKREIV